MHGKTMLCLQWVSDKRLFEFNERLYAVEPHLHDNWMYLGLLQEGSCRQGKAMLSLQ